MLTSYLSVRRLLIKDGVLPAYDYVTLVRGETRLEKIEIYA
jgi:hypothetical protein